jgi:hypothetical protein
MRQMRDEESKIPKLVLSSLVLIGLLTVVNAPTRSQERGVKPETFEAAAFGTDTQMGAVTTVTIVIYEYSKPEDRQILVQAWEKGQNQGLVNALSRMRAVGRIAITGTLGYDISYVGMGLTPTGRKIQFITNRQLRFGEVYWDTQSQSFNLTAGELNINYADKSKNTGVLYPAAQLIMDKQGRPQFDLNQNPWRLVDVIDWKGTPGVN